MEGQSVVWSGGNAGKMSTGAQAIADPRLHAINNRICAAVECVRAHTLGFNEKADAIVGSAPTGTDTSKAPTPVPNGALQQIEMALEALDRALEDLAAAERRFVGLA